MDVEVGHQIYREDRAWFLGHAEARFRVRPCTPGEAMEAKPGYPWRLRWRLGSTNMLLGTCCRSREEAEAIGLQMTSSGTGAA